MIRRSVEPDGEIAAAFAAEKRAEYEGYSPIFWRRSPGARELHRRFLRKCLTSDQFTAFTAEVQDQMAGVVVANHRAAMPPFRDDPEPSWLVDDFYVARPELWPSVGRRLLDAVASQAAGAGMERLIVVTAARDAPKRSFLLGAGFVSAACWWVHGIEPRRTPAILPPGVKAVVGPAPPVYDPGGLTALAYTMTDPGTVEGFGRWAAASNAVVAIVPTRAAEEFLQAALAAHGYAVASEWMTKVLSPP